MLWLKSLIFFLILVIVLALGVEFSLLHEQQVTINYLIGTSTQPLALVVIGAFAFGALLAALLSGSVVWPLRWRLSRLQQTLTSKEDEIRLLTKRLERLEP